MKQKNTIRKMIVLGVWFLVITGITTLLIAANRKNTEHLCKRVVVSIKGTGEKLYVEEADILKELGTGIHGTLVNRPVLSIPLATLEKMLERNQWIRDAQLYFDREDILHVSVEERDPVARIFTTGGASFYMDSSGHQMPLLDKISIRVPVITGYTNSKRMNARDSALLEGVKTLTRFVAANPFWEAQIGEIDITPERKFEIIPVIGDHIIRIGEAENLEEKFHNLLLFYKQVLSRTGFNKYSVVDIQYAGQVVGVNKGPFSRVDSIQLQKNIEELLKKSSIQNVSEEMLPEARPIKDSVQIQSMTAQDDSVAVKTNSDPAKKLNPVPGKTTSVVSRPDEKPEKQMHQKPKAVMKKRN
ncbi:MAG: cell division protein FtsQ/DivIB [Flavisolibacter sp.]